jgi:hypothetical protein
VIGSLVDEADIVPLTVDRRVDRDGVYAIPGEFLFPADRMPAFGLDPLIDRPAVDAVDRLGLAFNLG